MHAKEKIYLNLPFDYFVLIVLVNELCNCNQKMTKYSYPFFILTELVHQRTKATLKTSYISTYSCESLVKIICIYTAVFRENSCNKKYNKLT